MGFAVLLIESRLSINYRPQLKLVGTVLDREDARRIEGFEKAEPQQEPQLHPGAERRGWLKGWSDHTDRRRGRND